MEIHNNHFTEHKIRQGKPIKTGRGSLSDIVINIDIDKKNRPIVSNVLSELKVSIDYQGYLVARKTADGIVIYPMREGEIIHISLMNGVSFLSYSFDETKISFRDNKDYRLVTMYKKEPRGI